MRRGGTGQCLSMSPPPGAPTEARSRSVGPGLKGGVPTGLAGGPDG
jgi:hypothetical protein